MSSIEPIQTLPFLEEGPQRQLAMRQHPFCRNAQRIATPQIKAIHAQICVGLQFRTPGMSWEGPPRHGKTQTAKILVDLLNRSHPDVPVFFTSAKGHSLNVQTEKTLWGEMLSDWGHPGANVHRTQDRRENILNLIRAACYSSRNNQAILIVDEAQNWSSAHQWTQVKDLAISLADSAKTPIDLMTLSFGQSELAVVRAMLSSSAKLDLIGRFFLDNAQFHGIRSADELTEVLETFDRPEIAEFPQDSNVSYTQFFLPKAYAEDWRLADEAKMIWAAMIGDWAIRSKRTSPDVGMAAAIEVIKRFVFHYLPTDAPDFRGTPEMWSGTIENSHFRELQLNRPLVRSK
jgi:hypothetical protein